MAHFAHNCWHVWLDYLLDIGRAICPDRCARTKIGHLGRERNFNLDPTFVIDLFELLQLPAENVVCYVTVRRIVLPRRSYRRRVGDPRSPWSRSPVGQSPSDDTHRTRPVPRMHGKRAVPGAGSL